MTERGWAYPICDRCFDWLRPGERAPRVLEARPEVCCWCDCKTLSGIYYRGDPPGAQRVAVSAAGVRA